jgi:hypothetical protein
MAKPKKFLNQLDAQRKINYSVMPLHLTFLFEKTLCPSAGFNSKFSLSHNRVGCLKNGLLVVTAPNFSHNYHYLFRREGCEVNFAKKPYLLIFALTWLATFVMISFAPPLFRKNFVCCCYP